MTQIRYHKDRLPICLDMKLAPPVAVRRCIEQMIVRQIVLDALETGFSLGVFDGEETTVYRSTDATVVWDALFTVDEDVLVVYGRDGATLGKVLLVYGNSGWDVIGDYYTALTDLLAGAEALAEQIETVFV